SLPRAANSAGQFPGQFIECDAEHVLAPDDHIVAAGLHVISGMNADSLSEPPAYAVPDHRIADLLGNGQAISGREIVIAVQDFKQKQPSAALFTRPDGQKLLALLETLRPLASWPCHGCAALRQIKRTDACGRGRGERSGPGGRPWWPCVHGSRDGACEQALRVGRCASFV